MDFAVLRCPDCDSVVLDGAFQGVVRARCGGCRRRVWLVGDGEAMHVFMVDSRPKRAQNESSVNRASLQSGPTTSRLVAISGG